MGNKKPLMVQMRFDDETLRKIEELGLRYGTVTPDGAVNRSGAIRTIVAALYKKEFPDYLQVAKIRPDHKQREINKIEAQEEREKIKLAREEKKQESICLIMDEASIVDHPTTGRRACRYPVYTTSSPHHVDKTWYTEELSTLSDDTPALQYHGLFNETGSEGKKKVLEILAKMENPPV